MAYQVECESQLSEDASTRAELDDGCDWKAKRSIWKVNCLMTGSSKAGSIAVVGCLPRESDFCQDISSELHVFDFQHNTIRNKDT